MEPQNSTITKWNDTVISYQLQFDVNKDIPSMPTLTIKKGAECNGNENIPASNFTVNVNSKVSEHYKTGYYTGDIKDWKKNGLSLYFKPKFCAVLTYTMPTFTDASKSTVTNKTISTAKLQYTITTITVGGQATFTTQVQGVDSTDTKTTDHHTFPMIDMRRAFVTAPQESLPVNYRMGTKFMFCLRGAGNFQVTEENVKLLKCFNEHDSRTLKNMTVYDALTKKVADPTTLTLDNAGTGKTTDICFESYMTAGFFNNAVGTKSITCNGEGVSTLIRRDRSRLLQSDEEEAVTFATTFELDTVAFDTLTAGASVVGGAGLLISSVLLSMII